METTVIHKFWLRPDFEVEVCLPEDLSPDEAKRLGQMLSTLGRDEWE